MTSGVFLSCMYWNERLWQIKGVNQQHSVYVTKFLAPVGRTSRNRYIIMVEEESFPYPLPIWSFLISYSVGPGMPELRKTFYSSNNQ